MMNFHSSIESRENKEVSLLAIIETILFVIAVWLISWYYDYLIHIYIAICIAPFLMLKTPTSTNKAIELFTYEININEKYYYKDPLFWVITVSSLFILFIISYFLTINFLIGIDGFELFYKSLIIGIGIVEGLGVVVGGLGVVGGGLGVVGTVLGIVLGGVVVVVRLVVEVEKQGEVYKMMNYILISPIMLIVGLTIFVKATIIKILVTTYYTVLHPYDTFFMMAKNWKEQILVNDSYYSPELLPDIHKVNPSYQLSGFANKNEDLWIKIIIIPIWSFAYLYRLSIKSTAWFYFPLAFIANNEALENKSKKHISFARQKWKPMLFFELFVLIILSIYFFGSTAILDIIPDINNTINVTAVKELFAERADFFTENINAHSIWLILIASVLYWFTYLMISDKDHLKNNKITIEEKSNTIVYWFIRLRYMFWMIFLISNAVLLTNKYILTKFVI